MKTDQGLRYQRPPDRPDHPTYPTYPTYLAYLAYPTLFDPTDRTLRVSTVCVNDDDLVERARQGDPAAFGELVDRHRGAVYRAALAALGSHADAEDAAQDAFLIAYRRLGSFRGDASFKTWLLTIAWHQAINRRRGLVRTWRRMVEPMRGKDERGHAAMMENAEAAGPTPEQAAVQHQLRRDIRAAIRALSPKLRDALLLAQSGDYTYEEIGAMLRSPVGTIKWRVAQARRVVRKQLRTRGHGELG
jgi:RNA polymerase sigma-70 factor (ECF subfamily)